MVIWYKSIYNSSNHSFVQEFQSKIASTQKASCIFRSKHQQQHRINHQARHAARPAPNLHMCPRELCLLHMRIFHERRSSCRVHSSSTSTMVSVCCRPTQARCMEYICEFTCSSLHSHARFKLTNTTIYDEVPGPATLAYSCLCWLCVCVCVC